MSYFKRFSIIMAITTITILVNINDSKAFTVPGTTIYVKITNKLGKNKTLLLHCRSDDDDLGDHSLEPKKSYDFNFGESFLWTTLYSCGFTFDGQNHEFDIYDAATMNCVEHCWWEVKENGPCLYKDGKYSDCQPWKSVTKA